MSDYYAADNPDVIDASNRKAIVLAGLRLASALDPDPCPCPSNRWAELTHRGLGHIEALWRQAGLYDHTCAFEAPVCRYAIKQWEEISGARAQWGPGELARALLCIIEADPRGAGL